MDLATLTHGIADSLPGLGLEVGILIAVACLAWLLLARAEARYRSLLWTLVLLRLCVPVSMHLPVGLVGVLGSPAAAATAVTQLDIAAPVPQRTAALSPTLQEAPAEAAAADASHPIAASSPPLTPESESAIEPPPAAPPGLPSSRASVRSSLDLLGAAWLAGFSLLGALMLFQSLRLRARVRRFAPCARPELVAVVERLAERLAIRRPVRLLVAPPGCRLALPAVLGQLRPTVVLPASCTTWSAERLQPLLAHELVHVARWDPLLQGLERLVLLIYFFHPLVWLAALRLRAERELATDDAVVRLLGGRPLPYLGAMVDWAAEQVQGRALATAGVGLAERAGGLERRVRRMTSTRYRVASRVNPLLITLAVGLAIACAALAAQPAPALRIDGVAYLEGPGRTIHVAAWGRGPRLLEHPDDLRTPLATTEAKPGSAFSLRVPEDTLPVEVELSAAGHVALAYRVVLAEEAALPPAYLRRGEPLTVHVTRSGKGVAKALVSGRLVTEGGLSNREPGRWAMVVPVGLTDAEGSVEVVRPPPPCACAVDAVDGDGAWGHRERDDFAGGQLVLRLGSQPVDVTVLDDHGDPAPEVTLAEESAPLGTTVVTDEHGQARLQLPATGDWQVLALGHGLAGDEAGHQLPAQLRLTLEPLKTAAVTWTGYDGPLVLEPSWLPRSLLASPIVARGGAAELPIVEGEPPWLLLWGPGVAPSMTTTATDGATRLDITPSCGVEGVVTSADGASLPGVPVWVSEPGWWDRIQSRPLRAGSRGRQTLQRPWLPRVVSNATGRFKLRGLSPAALELEARTAGRPPARSPRLEPKPGDVLHAELVLGPGAWLRVRVVDPEGSPLPGTTLEVTDSDHPFGAAHWLAGGVTDPPLADPVASGATGEDGEARLEAVPVGKVALRLRRAGSVTRILGDLEVPAEGLDVGDVTMKPGVRLEGITVGPDGAPVAGAEVVASRMPLMDFPSRFGPPAAVSGDDGRFAIPDLDGSGELFLQARAEGLAPAEPLKVTLPPDDVVEVPLLRERSLSGRVVDADGRPVAGAGLSLMIERRTDAAGVSGQFMGAVGSSRTDRDGGFRIAGVVAGSYRLAAFKEGFRRTWVDVAMPPHRDLEGVEVTLDHGRELQVLVLDPGGAPAEGTEVAARPAISARTSQLGGSGGSARTGADGRAAIGGLAPGSFRVEARDKDGATGSVTGESGGEEVVVRLERPGAAAGLVLDATGAPAAGAEVSAYFQGPPYTCPPVKTGADGRFRLDRLPPGKCRIRAARNGAVPAREQVTIASDEEAWVELELQEGGEITGNVRGLAADELSACRVSAESTGTYRGTANVDGSGSFRVTGLPPARYAVTATVFPSGEARTVAAEVTSDTPAVVEIDFGEGVRLSGSVTRAGAAAPAVVVAARIVAGDAASTTLSDGDGRWSLGGLARGEYRVSALDGSGKVLTSRTVLVEEGTVVDLEIPAGRLSGVALRDDSGAPVANAAIRVTSSGPAPLERTTTTDRAGTFAFEELPDGAYAVQARAADDLAADADVEVAAGAAPELTLRLRPALNALLRVTDSTGSPPPVVAVVAMNGGIVRDVLRVPCDAAGRCKVGPLASGRWNLFVWSSEASAADLVAVEVPGPETAVRLRPRGTLNVLPERTEAGAWWVRAVDQISNLPVPVGVHATVGGGEWGPVGAAGLTLSVPAGSYLVQGRSPSGTVQTSQVEVLAGGTTEVTLRE